MAKWSSVQLVAIGSAIASVVQFLLSAIFMWSPHGLCEKTRTHVGKRSEFDRNLALVVGLTHSYRSQSDSDRNPRTVKQLHSFLSEYGRTPRIPIGKLGLRSESDRNRWGSEKYCNMP
jgi:hypothetical protein